MLTEQGRELLANFLRGCAMSPGGDLLTRSIDSLASGHDLTLEQTSAVLAEIMTGNASEVQIAAFLIALRTKGETVEELAGLASTMRELATPVAGRPRRTCSTPPAPAAAGGPSTSPPPPR